MGQARNKMAVTILLSACVLLGSCVIGKKRKDKKVIGAWNVVNVMEMNATITEQWVFSEDGKMYRLELSDTGNAVIDEGDWALTQKINVAYLNTTWGTVASEQSGLNVPWEVLKLNKKNMILVHQDGGLLTREFERAK